MNKDKKNYWLYVLKLEQEKFYIGVTANTPEARMKQHVSGFAGARWTKKYKPLKIFDKKLLGRMTYDKACRYENRVLRQYIKKYGINRVRGGDITDDVHLIVVLGRVVDTAGFKSLLLFLIFAAIMTALVIIT